MKINARILTVILTLTLIISCCVIPAQADIMPYKYGDVNMSENVDIMDVTEIQNHLAQIESIEPYLYEAADVDADAKITIYDATTVQRYLAGIIDKFQSAMAKGGGFMLATGCEYPANASFDRAQRMIDIAKTYGKYE